MRRTFKITIALAAAATLSACINSDLERAGVGAAGGAATALLLDGNVVVGTALGAGLGATCDDLGLC